MSDGEVFLVIVLLSLLWMAFRIGWLAGVHYQKKQNGETTMNVYRMATLIDRDNNAVHTTGRLEVQRGLFGVKFPKVVAFEVYQRGEVLFFDTGGFTSYGFRAYREAHLHTSSMGE